MTTRSAGFLRRVEDVDPDLVEAIRPVVCYWRLGSEPVFVGSESSYREGVEYRVQRGLRLILGDTGLVGRVVSRVRTNRTVQYPIVRERADAILADLRSSFPDLFVGRGISRK